jgi:hypothetical protein
MHIGPQQRLREPLRFNRNSGWALFCFALVIAGLRFGWPELFLQEWENIFRAPVWYQGVDWLLVGIFLFFALCFSLDPNRQDIPTVAAGFFGGALIEIWGTHTGLWYYYTGERPPLWIIPAWGASALVNEKLLHMLALALPVRWRERLITGRGGTRGERIAHFILVTLILGGFLWWTRPVTWQLLNLGAIALIVAVMIASREYPLYTVLLWAVSGGFGVFLEIWGTTRHCWNYYDHLTPSPFPICAHGFAAVIFWRFKEWAKWG